MQKPSLISRISNLDCARGIALIAMATYHFSWDLELFGYLPAGTASSGFLKYYARFIASSFLFLAGFSLVLATLNGVKWPSFLKRLGMVGGAALVISIATYFAFPEGWIFFGILHHIAAASLIGLVFIRLPWPMVLIFAVAAFALPYFGLVQVASPLLSFTGLFVNPPNSNDFVPLFPWLSASLAGIAAAKIVLANGWIERLAAPQATKTPARQLKFLGQHSLAFYLIHQPVLIGLVWLAAQIAPPAQKAVGVSFQADCQKICTQNNSGKECDIYCLCFETELTDKAAQWSQLPVEQQTKAISDKCSIEMRANP